LSTIESVNVSDKITPCENNSKDIVNSKKVAAGQEHDGDQIDSNDDVVAAESIDADSVDSDDTSDIILPSLMTKPSHERNEDIDVSRQDGRIVIAAPLISVVTNDATNDNKQSSEIGPSAENAVSNSSELDSWATVEVRSRNSRKKPLPPPSPITKPSTPFVPMAAVVSDSQRSSLNKKSKSSKSNGMQKKKGVAQKIVGDILTSVIDSIDDESKRMKQLRLATPPRPINSWKNGPPGVIQKVAAGFTDASVGGKRDPSVRDILLGKSAGSISSTKYSASNAIIEVEDLNAPSDTDNKDNSKNTIDKATIRTDQNTAPTYQDTSSSSSNAILGSKEEPQNTIDRKSDTSSSETEEVPQNDDCEIASKLDAVDASTPPLPTLLSPANANSANSSVASSLEAPPRGRAHHHSDTERDVNDVGYHLLDVCDRLSRDMSLFMSRRALALSARRRERGAILSALQSSVASIWPGMCHVELYGSCATQLDLPSSDIDVVVLGLHRKSYSDTRSSSIGSLAEESYVAEDVHLQMQQLIPSPSYGMLPHHRNAEQVIKLAADLEKQPWAVQVNAIPTASVPVIKVLADPSKLSGASSGSDWMTQHQQMAGQAATAAGGVGMFENRPNPEYSKADSGSYPPPNHVPWRGSDVMKGLLSLDITFEGPEHGGIGSTEFSTRTVAESCEESGLHPDATPFVQTLMVLKELLAQRKLNEPYSGGLSSYALLLLVLALVRERAVIREEIELVEQQRRAMAVGELNSFPNGSIPPYDPDRSLLVQPNLSDAKHSITTEAMTLGPKQQKATNQVNPRDAPSNRKSQAKSTTQSNLRPSSWAMIAKMNPGPKSPIAMTREADDTSIEKEKGLVEEKVIHNQSTPQTPGQKPSFADAVVGSKSSITVKKTSAKKMGKPSSDAKSQECSIEKSESIKEKRSEAATSVCNSVQKHAIRTTSSVSPIDPKTRAPAFYPQGYNDIVEVLCSGETTAGKLLMHFLLYYGQHFDAQSTAIDISGKHERHYDGQTPPNSYLTPYIQRQSLGNIDPITGMLTVDPIVIYDPLEGAENNNVSRRCFAWNSVRWIFAQSYATLASAVERSATPPTSPNGGAIPQAMVRDGDSETFSISPDTNCDLMDPSSPLLRCLLSF
jgi:DNA polymerase sigma